jgi:hypothetical protein
MGKINQWWVVCCSLAAFVVCVYSQPVDILTVNYSTCAGSLLAPYNKSTSLNWTRADNFFYTLLNRNNPLKQLLDWTGQVAYCQNISKFATLPTPISEGDWDTLISFGFGFNLGLAISGNKTNGIVLKPDGQWYWLDGRPFDWSDPVIAGLILSVGDPPGGLKNASRVYFNPSPVLIEIPFKAHIRKHHWG